MIDGIEYLSNSEAQRELNVASSSTLKDAAKRYGIKPYRFPIAPNRVWWKKSDIERLKTPKPIEDEPEK